MRNFYFNGNRIGALMHLISPEDWKEIYSAKSATGNLVCKTNKFEIVQLEIKPGGIIEEHALPFQVVFYVLEGTGELLLEGKSLGVTKDNCINCEPSLNRGWKNESSNMLKILVTKYF